MEMAAFAGARVTGVTCAVVTDLEQSGFERGLERGAQPVDARAHADSLGSCPRMSQKITPAVNTNTSGSTIHDLKVTQVSWLIV